MVKISDESYQQIENIIHKIDWPLLHAQKLELINAVDECRLSENINGLINLIDVIQDYAVDVLGHSAKEVFNIDEEDQETPT